MISYDKVSLPACTFGAGFAHAAVLALVLPILITLPAPGTAPRLVAIPVIIVAEPPVPAVTEPPAPPVADAGDAIGALVQRTSLEDAVAPPAPSDITHTVPASTEADTEHDMPDDTTGALPDPALVETPEADGNAGAVEADMEPDDAEPSAVAKVDAVLPPLPVRVRREPDGGAIVATPKKDAPPRAKPIVESAPRRVVTRRPAARPDIAPYKGSWEALLGKPAVSPIDKTR